MAPQNSHQSAAKRDARAVDTDLARAFAVLAEQSVRSQMRIDELKQQLAKGHEQVTKLQKESAKQIKKLEVAIMLTPEASP